MTATDDRLQAALERQEVLVDRFEGVRRTNRILVVIVAVLVVVVVALAILVVSNRRLTDDLRANTAADQAEQDAQAQNACRLRNEANAVVREQFVRYNDTFDRLIPQPHSATQQAAIDQLRSSVPTAEATDRDCDGDGGLGPADYPPS